MFIPNKMLTLPIELLQLTVQYMDIPNYDERTRYNRMVPYELRIIKKIDLKEHDRKIKEEALNSKIEKIKKSGSYLKKCHAIRDFLDFILMAQDMSLFKGNRYQWRIVDECDDIRKYVEELIRRRQYFANDYYHVQFMPTLEELEGMQRDREVVADIVGG